MTVNPDKSSDFIISLRVPSWSLNSTIEVNGVPRAEIKPGSYARISRTWNKGDKIIFKADVTGHLIDLNGYQAVVRGPVVLARDTRFVDGDVDEAAVINHDDNIVYLKPADHKPENVWMAFTAPMVLGTNLEGESRNPHQVHLCDFASAGNTWREDSRYRVWIPRTLNVMNMKYSGN